jgi:hypothetical protein
MVGLLDIADLKPETVKVRGTDVPVNGITITVIARCLRRFPKLEQVLTGDVTLSVDTITEAGPDVIAAVIAAGTGMEGSAEAEAKAATLLPGEQLTLLVKIGELTLGEGAGPFVERARNWIAARAAVIANDGKVPDTRSRRPSKDSLLSATTPEMFGSIHRGNSQASPS